MIGSGIETFLDEWAKGGAQCLSRITSIFAKRTMQALDVIVFQPPHNLISFTIAKLRRIFPL